MKGDYIEIAVSFGASVVPARITATKAGGRWITVTEVTRTGKPAGDSLRVRFEAVISIREHRVDATEQAAIRRARKAVEATEPLWGDTGASR
jgi:hypothetical protein